MKFTRLGVSLAPAPRSTHDLGVTTLEDAKSGSRGACFGVAHPFTQQRTLATEATALVAAGNHLAEEVEKDS